jgi:transcriptional pleiotropic regulator of transition state genes
MEMKATGIVRHVDHLGRIVLPKEIRTMLQINEKENVEIYVENGWLCIQKHNDACIFCGSGNDLLFYFRGKIVCFSCSQEMHLYFKNKKAANATS